MKRVKVYKLYGTAAASTNALAQLTLQRRGVILGCKWASMMNSITDNDAAFVELAFSSVNTVTTNDATGSLSQVCHIANFVTSGLANHAANCYDALHVPCSEGDRVYMHLFLQAGTPTVTTNCFLYVEEDV